MLEFLTNAYEKARTLVFGEEEHTEQIHDEPTSCQQAEEQKGFRTYPLASSLGAQRRTGETSGHWSIRGQELFLDYKRQNKVSLEISQPIAKAEVLRRKGS